MAESTTFIEHLYRSGIRPGDVLVFETASQDLETIGGDLDSLVSALQELVGNGGTLVVPTCTPEEGRPKPTFDPILSPSEMGPFSEFFRKQPGVLRSHNPTHSVAARGSMAGPITSGHRTATGRFTPWGEGSFGKGSPWDVLYESNAWWVMLDAAWSNSPFITYLKALYVERHQGITKQIPFPEFGADELGRELQRRQHAERTTWNQHTLILFRTRQAIDSALDILDHQAKQLRPDEAFSRWLKKVDYIKKHGYLRAGVARVKITPSIPSLRWEGKPLTGVYRDLYARAVVLSRDKRQVALVLCDLLGISAELVKRIRQKVQEEIGFPGEAIQIACTHAHSTPDTIGSGYEDQEYLDFLVEAVTRAVVEAAANRQSARLGWGRAPIRGLAHSRRKKMPDGKVFTTRYGVPSTWRVKPDLIVGEGTIDPDLTVIKIERLDGEVLAAISNFACHASVALMSSNVSGDFPGEAMTVLESILGQSAVALATNGAAADVDPTLEMPYWGPRDDAMARHLGRIFAAQVLECLERIEVDDIITVDAAQEVVDLEVRPNWISLLESEQERMRQEFSTGWSMTSILRRTLEEQVIHTEVHALRLNGLILVGFPGEIFSELGLRLKAETKNVSVAVVELANDDIGYIAPVHAFAEGGYEVGQHLWGRVTPEAEEALLTAARRTIARLTNSYSFEDR